MSSRRIEITVSEDTWGRLEAARGHEPRASFVKRALEAALGPAEPYPFEAERQAVRAAVAAGAQSVRVEAGSIVPEVSGGCPECGGSWATALAPEGNYRICRECGARESR